MAVLVLFVVSMLTLRCMGPTSRMPTTLTTIMATMPGSLQVILESTSSKLHDEFKDCVSYAHEKKV